MKRRDGTMLCKILLTFSLFFIPVVVLMAPLAAQSDPLDLEEVAHMKAGHQQVEGVVTEVKSGLYTVKDVLLEPRSRWPNRQCFVKGGPFPKSGMK